MNIRSARQRLSGIRESMIVERGLAEPESKELLRDLTDAAYMALDALRTLSERIGDDPIFNHGGAGYEAVQALKKALRH